MNSTTLTHFHTLDPQHALDDLDLALESLDKERCTGRILALNSLENRVYLVELEDGSEVVTKFYRPSRWSLEQIAEEHDFIKLLNDNEIPAVGPLRAKSSGQSIFKTRDGILLSVFPKVQGRLTDELSLAQAKVLGRYLARLHRLGETFPLQHRPSLDLSTFGDDSLDELEASGLAKGPNAERYLAMADQFLDLADPILLNRRSQTVHGDCHVGNILWQGEAPFLIDFDDLTSCLPAQDIWLIAPGRDTESLKLRDAVLDGYAEFGNFDMRELECVEALRGLRMIHYLAWIARRWSDPIFPATFARFGSEEFWQEETQALMESMEILSTGSF